MKTKKPLRKCIITNKVLSKENLFRVVVNKNNEVFLDLTLKAHGRGYYIKKDKDVIKKVVEKDILSKKLKKEINKSLYDEILKALDK